MLLLQELRLLLLLSLASRAPRSPRTWEQERRLRYQAPPPPPPVFSWTGCYVGANIGGGWASNTSNDVAGAVTAWPGPISARIPLAASLVAAKSAATIRPECGYLVSKACSMDPPCKGAIPTPLRALKRALDLRSSGTNLQGEWNFSEANEHEARNFWSEVARGGKESALIGAGNIGRCAAGFPTIKLAEQIASSASSSTS